MQRIMIIGNCGSGKTTFAKKLGSLKAIEIIHLDKFYYGPNWKGMNSDDWKRKVSEFSSRSKWIIDGNYSSTLDIRIKNADTIIYLNYSTVKCLWRITKRILKSWRKERIDNPKGCKERFDLRFYKYVASFNYKRRDGLLIKLEKCRNDKNIFVFKSDKETSKFLQSIKTEPNK